MLDLTQLSVEQRAVVLAGDGPLLVVAGPGSGKTTVLAGYVAHLVAAQGVEPTSVLAVTFTTAAARELRTRLATILGDPGRAVDVTTLHAFGLRIVRQWSSLLGLGDGTIAVYDVGEARRLLREAAEDAGASLDDLTALEWAVERYRLAGATIHALPGWELETDATAGAVGTAGTPGIARTVPAETVAAVADAYEELLQRRRAVDYPAMLALPLRLLEAQESPRRLYQDAYRYVLCDECQDLCRVQYALLRLLAARHRNLLLVGDPRQTLYSWRGADERLFRAFVEDFPEAQVHSLDENFRAGGRLVALANAFSVRLGYARSLWTHNPPGETARLHAAADDRDEATFVAWEIQRLLSEGRIVSPGDVAVLYRTNRQAREVALALRLAGLPYRIRGGGDLFSRREVRDALAYLRLARDPLDGLALMRIMNAPPRRLARLAARLGRGAEAAPDLDHLPDLAREYGPAAAAGAEGLVALVRELHERGAALSKHALLAHALERSGYRDWVAAQAVGSERIASLDELERIAARSSAPLGEWLDELQLGAAAGDHSDHGDETGAGSTVGSAETAGAAEAVLLSTVHAAKGGEWPVVFLVGAEEGILPHRNALGVPAQEDAAAGEGIQGERRVAYVAVTRPRDRLYVTYCRERERDGKRVARRPSRFLHEVPAGLLACTTTDTGAAASASAAAEPRADIPRREGGMLNATRLPAAPSARPGDDRY